MNVLYIELRIYVLSSKKSFTCTLHLYFESGLSLRRVGREY